MTATATPIHTIAQPAPIADRTWAPKPGSLAHRLCEFLARNPEEELTVADIAAKFDVLKSGVQSALIGAEAAGAVVVSKDDTGRRIYRIGTYAAAPIPADAVRAEPAPTTRHRLPSLDDIAALKPERRPFPDLKQQRQAATAAIAARLAELSAGECLPVLPGARALYSAAAGLMTGRRYTVRRTDGGEFCWRVA